MDNQRWFVSGHSKNILYDIFLLEKKAKKEHRPFYGSLTRAERNEFIKKLQKNIIVFRYKKKNEIIRKAEGTLHPKFLPPPKSDKEIVRPEYQMVYYDFDRKDWRSFRSFEFNLPFLFRISLGIKIFPISCNNDA